MIGRPFHADSLTICILSGTLARQSRAKVERSLACRSDDFSVIEKSMGAIYASRQCIRRSDTLLATLWSGSDDNAADTTPLRDHR